MMRRERELLEMAHNRISHAVLGHMHSRMTYGSHLSNGNEMKLTHPATMPASALRGRAWHFHRPGKT